MTSSVKLNLESGKMLRSDTPGVVRAFGDDYQAAEKAGMWFKAAIMRDQGAAQWLQRSAPTYFRAMNESSGVAGGYIVPQELADRVYALLPLAGVFYAN